MKESLTKPTSEAKQTMISTDSSVSLVGLPEEQVPEFVEWRLFLVSLGHGLDSLGEQGDYRQMDCFVSTFISDGWVAF